VLTDFGIRQYFNKVIESAVVGVRKPDAHIYQLGVNALGFPAEACAVIGDSYTKDILPAKKVGCKAVWLNVKGWEDTAETIHQISEADVEITDFTTVSEALTRLS
jgi:FMN hydrolase / 5-amino-6-(5-phospho-D-ribitylamino)uracil phosphatase